MVNTTACAGTDTAPASPEDTLTDTSEDGRVANLTEKVPEPSSEIDNESRSNTSSAVSSSATDTSTSAVTPL